MTSALQQMKSEATAVLSEISEPMLLALATHIEAATEIRGKLVALQWHFQRHGGPAALLLKRLHQIPDVTIATDDDVRRWIADFRKLADRLLGDPTATLDEPHGGQNVAA
jgi:hypothetical protein